MHVNMYENSQKISNVYRMYCKLYLENKLQMFSVKYNELLTIMIESWLKIQTKFFFLVTICLK